MRLRKSLASVDATRASFYPSLTLTGSVGGSSSALSDVLRDPIGTLGAGLLLPFVQWRDMGRSVAISEADHEIAVRGYRQTWYEALADVENALSARVQYEDQGARLDEALQAAQKSERLAEARARLTTAQHRRSTTNPPQRGTCATTLCWRPPPRTSQPATAHRARYGPSPRTAFCDRLGGSATYRRLGHTH